MEKIIKIYDSITVKSIIYESGDLDATILCNIHYGKKSIATKLIVSQTDLNRLLSKMTSTDSEWLETNKESLYLEDGTQLIEYNFAQNTPSNVENFHFQNAYAQIGA